MVRVIDGVVLLLLFAFVSGKKGTRLDNLIKDIQGQKDKVKEISDYITQGDGRHQTWNGLALWGDTYGGRLCGSKSLEDSIDGLLKDLTDEGFDNVHTEEVKVPKWTRGEESAYMMVGSREKHLAITGLGSSVGTPPGGITAEVIVINSFEHLEMEGMKVKDKIVVYNPPWEGYGKTGPYRFTGAARAAKFGAVASLVRSMTPVSLYTLHTGAQKYEVNVTKIPAAAITVEDAAFIERVVKRGVNVTVHIEMGAENHGDTISRNIIADIAGNKYPEEVVMFGGHLDSWDLAEGVQDDGVGIFLGIQILKIMKNLNLKPKRTMRFVGWTCEEVGVFGGDQYYDRHWNSTEEVILAMEADSGVIDPVGIGFSGNGLAVKMMEEVMKYLEPWNVHNMYDGGASADNRRWIREKVPRTPVVNLWPSSIRKTPEFEYFEYHHSPADSMTSLDPDQLDRSQLVWTIIAYVVSNINYQDPIPVDGQNPSPTLEEDILEHQDETAAIISYVTQGDGKGVFWDDLAWWTDTYWNRLCGSPELEESIDGLKNWLILEGFSNVSKELVEQIPRWVRGNEWAKMIMPRNKTLNILGLGASIGTAPDGITAEVLVVSSFEELHDKSALAQDKIVVFNQEWLGYGETSMYRRRAAQEGIKVGAVAVLVRSLASRSLGTPHTGIQDYGDYNETDKIPTASITVEDAELLHRIYNRGETIEISLYMEAMTYPGLVNSSNLVAELLGSEHPEQVVIIGGHLDNWDVGQGAMDDGSGVFNAIEVLKVVKALGLKPKRTLRFVGWTCEEIGGSPGGTAYYERHKDDADNIIIAMENDYGTFMPNGIGFTGNKQAVEYMQYIMKLMSPLNATHLSEGGDESDTYMWDKSGVPLATFNSKGGDDVIANKYFYYHHTDADTMTVYDPAVLDAANAMWTSIAYLLADTETALPHGKDEVSTQPPDQPTTQPPDQTPSKPKPSKQQVNKAAGNTKASITLGVISFMLVWSSK